MVYMLCDATTEINNVVFNDIQYINSFFIDNHNDKKIIAIVCNEKNISDLIQLPQCLGSNDADLALKNPDIAKKILKVNIKNDNEIEMISYGDVTKDMKVISQLLSPITIF